MYRYWSIAILGLNHNMRTHLVSKPPGKPDSISRPWPGLSCIRRSGNHRSDHLPWAHRLRRKKNCFNWGDATAKNGESYGKIKPSHSTSIFGKGDISERSRFQDRTRGLNHQTHADLSEDGDTKQGESENQDRQGCQHLALTVKKWDVNSIANLRYPAKK